jgi:ABC-type uncharacterized transport system permease subunit
MGGPSSPTMALLLAALALSVPLVLAALGGIFSERSGVVNIGLEGMMLTGAFVGMWVGQVHGVGAGIAAALASGLALGLLHYALTQRFGMNHIISGVAINLLAVNGTSYFLRVVFNAEGRSANVEKAIPVGAFILLAVALVAAVQWTLNRTVFGLRLRAAGESAESSRMAGVSPLRYRLLGVLLSGALAALAGAYLSMSQTTRFSDNMVNGRGYIALAAVVCGRWRPVGAALAALAFGFFDALQIQLQGRIQIPTEFLQMMPYVFTILSALLLRPVPPADLGREEA